MAEDKETDKTQIEEISKIFNAGPDCPRTAVADGVSSFDLTPYERIFFNVVNLQLHQMSDALLVIVKQAEDQIEKQANILNAMKQDFLTAMVARLGLQDRKDLDFSIDPVNNLLVATPKKKDKED